MTNIIRAEMLLQAAFFATANPLFVVEWHTRRILAASESVERVFGYRPENIRDRTTEFLHAGADGFQRFGELSERALSPEQPIYHCYYRMRRRDGTVFDSEHLLSLVTDENHEPLAVISIVQDLSEKDRPLLLPQGREPDFRLLSENIPGGLFQRMRTPDGTLFYTYMRGILFHRMGVDPAQGETDARIVMDRIHQDDRQRLLAAMERTAETLSPIDLEVRVLTRENEYLWVRTISQPRRMEDGSVIWDGILLDITQQRHAEEELSYLAMYDALTSLPNARLFDNRLNDAIIHARVTGRKVLVAVLNIDRFYTINERLGYNYGDMVLRTVAGRLLSITRGNDVAARLQSDEFLVMIQDLAGDEEINAQAARLQSLFNEAVQFDDESSLSIRVKIGMALFPGDANSPESLRRAADAALKHARRSPDLDHAFYTPEMTRRLVESMELETALRDDIGKQVIEPWYQPQYDLADGRITGFETLARWPRNGHWVSPERFIPLAEETGLIHPLGKLFVDKVLAGVSEWKREQLRVPPVAVNVSAYQIRKPDMVQWLTDAIDRHGLDIGDLTLEITESAFLLDFEGARDILNTLHAGGVRMSMDDFGTGFSSLSYLSQLPFAELKIDRTFISILQTDSVKAAIVQGIIDLAHALKLRVVAEGVETVEQLQTLRDMRCDAAQGYLFARPAPAGTFVGDLRSGEAHPVFAELHGGAADRRKGSAAPARKMRKKTAGKVKKKGKAG